jgi:hypothetical protein
MRILYSRFIDLLVTENSFHEIQTAYSAETLSLRERTAVAITTDVAVDNADITITTVSLLQLANSPGLEHSVAL